MKKYGEIGRFKENDLTYVILIEKFDYKQLIVPWLNIYITKKTVKKVRSKTDKIDNRYCLLKNTFNISTMKKIENLIKAYLEEIKPEIIAISAHDDAYERRIKLYTHRLNVMGYEVFEVNSKINYMPVSYFRRKEYVL